MERINYKQLYLTPSRKDGINLNTKLKQTDKAYDVLEEVLRLNPQIAAINLVFYGYQDNSLNGEFSEDKSVWIPVEATDKKTLEKIGILNYKWRDEGKLMAIASRVQTSDGSTRHIPLMDFDHDFLVRLTDDEESEELELKASILGFLPGAILKSDHAGHYWGLNLMDEGEWRSDVKHRQDAEIRRRNVLKQLPVYDMGFLTASLKRGYSALRIFGYQDTDKSTEPEVVKIVNL